MKRLIFTKLDYFLLSFILMMILINGSMTIFGYLNQEVNVLADAKLVLYEGPKSIKTATPEDLKATSENLRNFKLLKSANTHLSVNGVECFVYETNVNHTRSWVPTYLPPISRTPIAYFDFEGKARLEITVDESELTQVSISPASYEIKPIIDKQNKTVTFDIATPDVYTVSFNGSPERAFHIFANPLETDLPDFSAENVVYVGPGEWEIENIILKDNQTLYLAGGAVVHGIVQGNFAKNIKVMGRGILDGSFYEGWKGKTAFVPLKFDNCDQVVIKDIIVLNSNAWVCQAYQSTHGLIDGLKIISPRPNGDGITLQSCQNYTVKNCFVRSWDDSLVVKNYGVNTKDIVFENCQLWTDLAQSMEIGYETNKGNQPNAKIENVTFENMTVLNNYHKPVISIHNGDDASVKGIVFKDIVVENAQMGSGDGDIMPYLIDFHIAQSSNWSTTKERGNIEDVLVENVQVLSGKFNPSRLVGYDDQHAIRNVTIRNLEILGEKILSFEQGKFEIDASSTFDIKFE